MSILSLTLIDILAWTIAFSFVVTWNLEACCIIKLRPCSGFSVLAAGKYRLCRPASHNHYEFRLLPMFLKSHHFHINYLQDPTFFNSIRHDQSDM